MKRILVLVAAGLLLLTAANPSWAASRRLADQELDQITAGDFSLQTIGDVAKLVFNSKAGPDLTVSGEGTISTTSQPLPNSLPSIVLEQGAQQNLHSLINIIAVNSQVNVLVNLSISLNSTIGNLSQLNLGLKP